MTETDFARLRDDVRGAQDALLDLRPLPPITRAGRGRARGPLLPMFVSAAVASLLVIVVHRLQGPEPPAQAAPSALAIVDAHGAPAPGGTVPLVIAAPRAVRVSDGSIVLVDEGRATLRELTLDRGVVALDAGRVSLSLPRATTTEPGWIVEAGGWRVDARGARVDVAYHGDRLTVRVADGEARVTSSTSATVDVVRAGEERAWPEAGGTPAPPVETARAAPRASAAAVDVADVAVVDSTAHDAPPAETIDGDGDGPTWQELARDDRHADAMNVARAHIDDVIARGSVDDVELLATSARLAASPDVAKRALLALRERAPGTAQAARAAFFLGVLADRAGDDDEALAHFTRSASEAPDGELVSEAMGRALEAGKRAGKDVRDDARAYLKRWPNGAHADFARRLLEAKP